MQRESTFHKSELQGYSMRRTCRYYQEKEKVPQKRNVTHTLASLAPGTPG